MDGSFIRWPVDAVSFFGSGFLHHIWQIQVLFFLVFLNKINVIQTFTKYFEIVN